MYTAPQAALRRIILHTSSQTGMSAFAFKGAKTTVFDATHLCLTAVSVQVQSALLGAQ